jgi:uncharacterized membrane protein YidH (DUF202 family)
MRNVFHLRFVVGVFSILIGILLLSQGFNDNRYGQWNLNKAIGWGYKDYSAIKRWCGAILMIFGIILTLLSFKNHSRNKLPPKG